VTSTRERLLDAAVALIAERGLRDVTVGDIEEGAGLTRGGRSYYRHFAAKEDVVTAAFDRHLEQLQHYKRAESLLPLGDLRAELTLVCRIGLVQMSNERDLVRILEKEGDRFPQLRRNLRDAMVDIGHGQLAGLIRRHAPAADAEALAVVLLGGIVNYRRNEWTFDGPALDVDEDRFIGEWVRTAHIAIRTAERGERA
jgi:AcrR family transcriptional regulator